MDYLFELDNKPFNKLVFGFIKLKNSFKPASIHFEIFSGQMHSLIFMPFMIPGRRARLKMIILISSYDTPNQIK